MDTGDTTPPDGFDIERTVPSRLRERWMVRADDGRSAQPAWEVFTGYGYDGADRAVEELRARFSTAVGGARIEVHTDKGCGHLHLRIVLVQGHEGLWEPFVSPLSAPPPALPVVVLLLRQTLAAAAPRDPSVTAPGGRA